MAVRTSGICLLAFLVVHLGGNLLFLAGPAAFNSYAQWLSRNTLVTVAEAALAVVFFVHAIAATVRTLRTENIIVDQTQPSAPLTPLMTGVIIVIFLLLHLPAFRFASAPTDLGMRDLYTLQQRAFSNGSYVLLYLICIGAVGLHLWRGLTSVAGRAIAVLVTAGFSFLPIYTWIGK